MKQRMWMEKIIGRTELPGENLPLQSLVEICGNSRVLVENHSGVTAYTNERIGIRVRFGTVEVHGQQLKVCQMSRCQLVISGTIQSVHLQKG
ncbi:MAG: hypothetical protein E7438_07895 [Ruminococcaceae bacterium]|nr:hypothetical protein [Oscillospiraceae bacterium]